MSRHPKRLRDLTDAEKLEALTELVEMTRRGHLVAAGFKLEVLAGVEDDAGQMPLAPWDAAAR